jgi:hypothetical protein
MKIYEFMESVTRFCYIVSIVSVVTRFHCIVVQNMCLDQLLEQTSQQIKTFFSTEQIKLFMYCKGLRPKSRLIYIFLI